MVRLRVHLPRTMFKRLRLAKEIQKVIKSVDRFSNGQAFISYFNPDDVGHIQVVIQPNDGLYEGGQWEFKINFWPGYPYVPPEVTCLSFIYHPNISEPGEAGNVCLSLFDEDWTSTFGLEECIQGLLYLLYNPNLKDPLNFQICTTDENTFRRNVKRSIREGYESVVPSPLSQWEHRYSFSSHDDDSSSSSSTDSDEEYGSMSWRTNYVRCSYFYHSNESTYSGLSVGLQSREHLSGLTKIIETLHTWVSKRHDDLRQFKRWLSSS